MGSSGGARGVWGYVEGGMGGLTQAMARAADERGVEIHLDSAVEKINISAGRITGVTLSGGETISARRVRIQCRSASDL